MTSILEHLRFDAQARLGQRISHWRLVQLIGIGGTAAVYEAVDDDGEARAIKIVHRELTRDRKLLRRVTREAELTKRIGHPGIVRIHEVGTDDAGALFMVMELLTGRSLEFVRRALGGKLKQDQVVWVATELLKVIAVAHERGVVHRDIKPSNLFVTLEGTLKVLDFGIARARDPSATDTLTLETVEGSVIGTPTFMAPEQARGLMKQIDARTDIWSVGATLFALASGRPVHEARNSNEALGLTMTAPARSIGTVNSKLSPLLVSVIDRALEFEADDRWPGALAMLSAMTGDRVTPTWTQVALPSLVEEIARRIGKEAGCGRSQVAIDTNQTRPQAPTPLAANTRHISESPTQLHAGSFLLESRYWSMHESVPIQVVFLRRTAAVVESTASLQEENRAVIARLRREHERWGVVVDMREAPARNDLDFERAMRFLRQELSRRFARISVLVKSAAGVLQVTRIDRGDGTQTYVTRSEPDATAFAKG